MEDHSSSLKTIPKKGRDPSTTDEEEEDDIVTQDHRKTVVSELRSEIKKIIEGEPQANNSVWVPDDRDMELLRKWIVTPVLKNSKNWQKFGRKEQDEVKKMVEEGTFLKCKKKEFAIIGETPRLYEMGLKQFMGLYQEELHQESPESLVDGRLHLWQFFEFKKANYLEIPNNIDHYLEKVVSPGMRSHVFCGYRQLVSSLMIFLDTTEAKTLFETCRFPSEEQLLQEEMKLKAKRQRMEEKNFLLLLKDTLKQNKHFGAYKGE